ncbi:hypothetical protein AMS68_006684 [Peltaster fructicola]|uniref:Fork-head domain-containing protein n=1 Tax=Peltaster fructicola TaxID=286661 RepID=A0A6H0Y2D8_9PEZI|nr:hypothetical protein AMS68_006684 [Peltaster fructicola]
MAIHMPNNTFDPFARDLGAFDDPNDATTLTVDPAVDAAAHTGYMASPAQQIFHDHSRPSNLRGAEGESDLDHGNGLQSMPASPIATCANLAIGQTSNIKNERVDMVGRFMNEPFDNPDPISAVSEMSLNLEEMKGYAQLVFPDGEYLVTSTEIMLGRDERAQQILKDQEKRQRKLLREQALLQARQHAAEMDAQAALERYKLEPGKGSEEGRRGSSSSSHMLEGRPAPGLPSTFSESGGIVNYEGSVDDLRKKRNKRRNFLLSRSSSNSNSVAPASLHVYGAAATPWRNNDEEKCIFLPIHPFQIEDIRKISKEHLRIFYDGLEKQWKMEIKGNGAFVLNELYKETNVDPETGDEDTAPRHFKRGDTVILTHNSEVLVTSLTFLFKLPQRRGFSAFDSDIDDDLETSLLQQPDDPDDDEANSEASDNVKQEQVGDTPKVKRPKILLKATKARPVPKSASPEPPRITGGKGKKKPVETPKVVEIEPAAQPENNGDNTQALPPVFDANSTLQHVPVNELPEKRKGPGRPPKNGLVSKRDEGIIRRKMKEYEKRGERPPPYKDILAIVRAENRAKELAARAAARGEPIPPTQLEMMNVVPTTEVDQTNDTPDMTAADAAQLAEASSMPRATSLELDTAELLKSAQQQQRTYKSPSPMKPKEEYTEEQLKRPTQTYYYILDEILSEGPEDAMELQQIYDKICKKYPFYKYVVESTGWQSSVRHNLKQNERFKPVSKQGKGWLWAIDPAIPLDKEKKKKPTPPPMPRPPMQYQAQNGMSYNNTGGFPQYGQTYNNGQPQYQQGTVQQSQQSYNAPYNDMQSPGCTSTRSATNTISSAVSYGIKYTQPAAAPPGALPPAFQDLVEEIMRFRVEYLTPFGKDAQEYARHERIFKRCVEWISQLHMRQNPEVKFENEEERRVFQILEKMRHKFEHGGSTIPPRPAQPAQTTSAGPVVTAPGQSEQSTPAAVPTQTLPAAPQDSFHGVVAPPAAPASAVHLQNQVQQPGQTTYTPSMGTTQAQGRPALPNVMPTATPDTAMQVPSLPPATESLAGPVSNPSSVPQAAVQDAGGANVSQQPQPSTVSVNDSASVAPLAAVSANQSSEPQGLTLTGIKRTADEVVDDEHDEKRAKM